MASHKAPVIITYRKPGTQPPVFVAGSYSEPQWQPQEMSSAVDADGVHVFKAEILVDPGSSIQYKFRLGTGDWWVLDENVESVTDELGNCNNVLKVPAAARPQAVECPAPDDGPNSASDAPEAAAEVASPPAPLNREGSAPDIRLPHGDIEEGPSGAADVPGSASGWLDVDPFASKRRERMDEDHLDAGQDRVPLFAHECLGSQDEASVGGGSQQHSPNEARHSVGFEHEPEKLELDDPDLEEFPSRPEQISELIHEVESELEEDETSFDGVPPPAVVGVPRRKTNDFVGDFIGGSPITSPSLSKPKKRLSVPRASRGSVASDVSSALSLQSIAEGGEEDDTNGTTNPVVMLPSPVSLPSGPIKSPSSEDDEAVVLESSNASYTGRVASNPIQDGERTTTDPSPKGPRQVLTGEPPKDQRDGVAYDGALSAADPNLPRPADGDAKPETATTPAADRERRRKETEEEDSRNSDSPKASAPNKGVRTAKESEWQRRLAVGSIATVLLGMALWWQGAKAW